MKHAINAVILLSILIAACDKKETKPDLQIPATINTGYVNTYYGTTYGSGLIEFQFNACFVNQTFFPANAMGTTIFINTMGADMQNEMFSLQRYDSINHSTLVFYWDHYHLPAFSTFNSNPVFRFPDTGEIIMVYKFIVNKSSVASPESSTGVTVLKVENGKATQATANAYTPAVPGNGYAVIKSPYTYQGQGIYNITFVADVGNKVVEEVEDNNTNEVKGITNMTQ